MPIDREVEIAVTRAVKEMGQSDLLAKKIIAWLRNKSEKELGAQEEIQHLEAVRSEVVLSKSE